MKDKQTETFRASEGDNWFERNAEALRQPRTDLTTSALDYLHVKPKKILEIGCSNGWRLHSLQKSTGATCFGIDPSAKAIEDGKRAFPEIEFIVGTADELPFGAGYFDLVLFGACFCLIDINLHFKVVQEADRVLADGGHLCIYDFQSSAPYCNEWRWQPGLFVFKIEFSRYFLAHPGYVMIHRQLDRHGPSFMSYDQRWGLDILLKDMRHAFPPRPFHE